MKTNSKFTRSLTAVYVAAALALAAPPVFGQAAGRNSDDEKRTRMEVDRANAQAVQTAREKQKLEAAGNPTSLFEIEIVDGEFVRKGKKQEATLENVVDLLRERHDGANIVLSPGLPRIKIMNLKLRATSVEQELEALRVASGNKFMWSDGRNSASEEMMRAVPSMVPGGGGGLVPDPSRNALPPKENQAPLYILSEVPAGMAAPGRQVEVFNLTDYFNSFGGMDEDNRAKLVATSLDEIKKIVATTLQLVDEDHSSLIAFQFHAGANLLVVSGTPDALEVARKVVGALGPQNRPAAGGFGGAGPDPWGNPYRPNPFGNALSTSSSKARRAIAAKLDSLRLDSVGPWDLPLAEVVKLLNDEAKKRDPEKRGVNFLINPNPPRASSAQPGAGGPTAIDPTTGLPIPQPPTEAIDINSVTIRITLSLSNVRLTDVLDAVVKVADHPIRYTITDYAVVFSLGEPEIPMSESPFPGAVPGPVAPLP